MSEQLQRYFAAVLGCAIAATWAAAGFGPALAGIVTSVAAYFAVAFAQRRGLFQSRSDRTAKRRQFQARRSSRSSSQHSGRGVKDRAQLRPGRWPAYDADLPDELDVPPSRAAGGYGW